MIPGPIRDLPSSLPRPYAGRAFLSAPGSASRCVGVSAPQASPRPPSQDAR